MKKRIHSLLRRRIREHLGGSARLSRKWKEFLDAVGEDYRRTDEDRATVEMSLASAFQELLRRDLQLTHDVRERIEIQRALKENEARFRALADSAPVLIWVSSPHGPCTYVNKTWTDFSGRPSEAEVGDGWKDRLHPEDRAAFETAFEEAFQAQEKFTREARLQRRDGEYRWLWMTGIPRRAMDGSFQGFVGTGVDITERRRLEVELRAGESRLRRQNETLMELAGRRNLQRGEDLEAALRDINEAAARTLEVERVGIWFFEGQAERLRCVDVFTRSENHHESGAVLAADDFPDYFKALREERAVAAHDARSDPRTRALAAAAKQAQEFVAMLDAPVRLGGQLVGVLRHEHAGTPRAWTTEERQFAGSLADLVALVVEAHEHRWAEEALLKSEERFQLVARATNDAVWDWDLTTDVLWCNTAVGMLFGYRQEEIGTTGDWWKSLIHSDDRASVLEKLEAVLSGGNDLWSAEYRMKKADGTYAFVLDRGTVLRRPDGKASRLIRAMTDLTGRRTMEKRLLQSEKLSAMGQLAAGIAHEINNPLGVILGFAQAVLRRLPPASPFEKSLRAVEREALRCRALVKDLLTFSHASDARREEVDINMCVEGALSLVLAQSKMNKVEVRREFGEGLPGFLGNINQVQQVIINLAANAMDAMPKGGVLRVRTELLVELAGACVCLKISDTGSGIPEEILPKIFDPFFTTKPVGRGTGLGLSLVHEIVKKHDGFVDVQSRPGFTEFCVKFPAWAGPKAGKKPKGAPTEEK